MTSASLWLSCFSVSSIPPLRPPAVDVLVVGAGPVGLTLACELARNGVSCRIIDKAAAPVTTSRALAIFPRTLEVFQIMNMIDPVLEAGHQLAGVAMYNRSGQIGYIGFDALPSRYRFALSLPQSETESLLIEHLGNFGHRVDREKELVGLSQSTDSIRAVIGTAGGAEEIFDARWVVGCDGAHSNVRDLLGLPFEGAAYDETFVLADVKLDGALDPVHVHMFLTEAGLVGIFPFRNDRWRIIATAKSESDGGPVGDPKFEEVVGLVESRTDLGIVGIKVTDAIWMSRFHISHRKIAEFRAGRAFLAGDSAHIHSPAGGQGMNTGIQDAFNLAWKLALVAHGKSPESLLNSYNEEREPVAKTVLTLTDRLTRMGTMQNPFGRQVRDALLSILTGIHTVEDRIAETMAEIGIHYRRSSIVSGNGGQTLRAGDRAPDCEFCVGTDRQTVRLYELLHEPIHHLLIFVDKEPDLEAREFCEEIERDFAGVIKAFVVKSAGHADGLNSLLDADSVAHALCGAESGAIFLIRPDGYIGFRGEAGHRELLRAYLGRIFSDAKSLSS